MELVLETHRHGTLGFSIDLPAGLVVDEDQPGVALVAYERPDALPPGSFLANLSVLVEDLGGELPLDAYLEGSLAEQERTQDGFRLIDREDVEVSGRPAVRTLAHVRDGRVGAVAEQWRLVDGRHGWIVTCTSDALGYDLTADVLTAAVQSLKLPEARA